MRTFKEYILLKEEDSNNWRKNYVQLEKGFVPPSKMRPVIEAFVNSGNIELSDDTKNPPKMPKKSLFLVGGAVRDILRGKTVKDYDVATNATPSQIAHILHAAGFKMSPERTGQEGEALNMPFAPKEAGQNDKKTWFIKGRDSSPERKPFVISAVVDGEEFEIATFRRDAKVTDGSAAVDFVDNPSEDAARRDLTINAMYIELTKADGENTKLYDPTGKGYHDALNNVVRTVGKAEDRFKEDKLRVLRAVRFHCRFGGGAKLDDDIEKAIPRFKNLEGVALERVRDEFLKALLHPDTDVRCYLSIMKRTGLLQKVFPNVQFDPPSGVPAEFTDKKDKPLALAWLLQHNPVEKVNDVLGSIRNDTPTGWSAQERKAVVYLLRLKDFSPDEVWHYARQMTGTGLTRDQIRDWVQMFNVKGQNRNQRPLWAKQVNAFSEYQPGIKWDAVEKQGQDFCSNCKGAGCAMCRHSGKIAPHMRGQRIAELEAERFKSQV